MVGQKFSDAYFQKIQNIFKETIPHHVIFDTNLTEVQSILRIADIAIITSKSEGLPLALLEYGACKLPVVATNVGNISEVIKHNLSGYLVNSQDIKTFAEYLLELMHNQSKRQQFGEALYHQVITNHSQEVFMTGYFKLLGQLV